MHRRILRKETSMVAFDAAGPFVYWVSAPGYVERMDVTSQRWERQRFNGGEGETIYIEDVAGGALGAVVLARHELNDLEGNTVERKLWWVQGTRWGDATALFELGIPDVLGSGAIQSIEKVGERLVMQAGSDTSETLVALVGWRRLLSPITCSYWPANSLQRLLRIIKQPARYLVRR